MSRKHHFSLKQIHDRIVAVLGREFRRLFSDEGPLIPIPIRAGVDQRRLDPRRSRD